MQDNKWNLWIGFFLCIVCLTVGYSQRDTLARCVHDAKYRLEIWGIRREIVKRHPQLEDDSVSDFEKVCLLRDWAYGKYVWRGDPESEGFDYWWNQPVSLKEKFVDLTKTFSEFGGAGQCGGAAAYLVSLYDAFGYEAISLDYYITEYVSHVVTLVKIKNGKENKWICQDASLNRTYVDLDGNPIDVFTMTQMLYEGQTEGIQEQFGDTRTRYVVFSKPPAVSVTENSADIEPGTVDCYIFPTHKYEEKNDRYGILVDMRQPGASEREFSAALEATLIPRGYPPKAIYLYIYPYAYYVSNTEEGGGLLSKLQEAAHYITSEES